MYEAKTKATTQRIIDYIEKIEDETRRNDCQVLLSMMERVSGCKAVMWGTDIVGFCKYHYKYASGHEGDSGYIGFSSRKGDISVYLTSGFESPEAKGFLAQLGKHKIGKVCLYIRRLSDVNVTILEQLVAYAVADCRIKYPQTEDVIWN